MTTTKKQRYAIAGIVIVGALLGAAVLMPSRGGAPAAGSSAAAREPGAPTTTAVGTRPHVELTAAQIEAADIAVAIAGAATLQAVAQFPGEIRFDEDRTAHVVPRAGGVVEGVSARLGQQVRRGQVLATIGSTTLSDQRSELLTAQKRRDLARTTWTREKKLWEERISAQQDYLQADAALQEADIAVRNASQKLAAVGVVGAAGGGALNRLDIRAPFDGTIVEKHVTLGEFVKEDAAIFTVADLTTVRAEFAVAAQDLPKVRVGRRARIASTAFDGVVDGIVSYVGALLGEQTRTARARVTLANPDGAWRPGLFVTVTVADDDRQVALAVGTEAVQRIDGEAVVFVVRPGGFEARPVKLGRGDGSNVEVLEGLRAGEAYAASNTFVLKADLGKAGAEHGH